MLITVIYIRGNSANLKQQDSVTPALHTIQNLNFTKISIKNTKNKSNEAGELWSKLNNKKEANSLELPQYITEETIKLKQKITNNKNVK